MLRYLYFFFLRVRVRVSAKARWVGGQYIVVLCRFRNKTDLRDIYEKIPAKGFDAADWYIRSRLYHGLYNTDYIMVFIYFPVKQNKSLSHALIIKSLVY